MTIVEIWSLLKFLKSIQESDQLRRLAISIITVNRAQQLSGNPPLNEEFLFEAFPGLINEFGGKTVN